MHNNYNPHVETYVENRSSTQTKHHHNHEELTDLNTAPTASRNHNPLTHSQINHNTQSIHNLISSGVNQFIHTIHSTNSNNNLIIRRG